MTTTLESTEATPRGSSAWVGLAYVGAFVGVELLGLVDPLFTAVGHAVLVAALVNHAILAERGRPQPFLLALAVVCLYRLLAFTPLPAIDFTSHLVVVGAPALLATVLALRMLHGPGLRALWAALRPSGLGWQLLVAVLGAPLSLAAYELLKPGLVVAFTGPGGHARALQAAVALAVFSGFGEELTFRALLHGEARGSFGSAALYVSSVVFGAAYVGTRSIPFVLFVLGVGALFGWIYERTGSILGSAVAHSLISIGVFVVWPSVGHLPHL